MTHQKQMMNESLTLHREKEKQQQMDLKRDQEQSLLISDKNQFLYKIIPLSL